MPAQQCPIGNHDLISHQAIMGHMRIPHEKNIIANARNLFFTNGSVNGDSLPNTSTLAHLDSRGCRRIEREILRFTAHHRKMPYPTPIPKHRSIFHDCMGLHKTIGAQFNLVLHNRVRAYPDIRAQFRPCSQYGGFVNRGSHPINHRTSQVAVPSQDRRP